MKNQNNRRDFLKTSAALGAASVPYFAWARPSYANRSKNDRPQIGCIGVG